MRNENRFYRYELRTIDPMAARGFYADILGIEFWNSRVMSVVKLPERAAAASAPSHWLGHIGVKDVQETIAQVIERGGEQLGRRSARRGLRIVRVQ